MSKSAQCVASWSGIAARRGQSWQHELSCFLVSMTSRTGDQDDEDRVSAGAGTPANRVVLIGLLMLALHRSSCTVPSVDYLFAGTRFAQPYWVWSTSSTCSGVLPWQAGASAALSCTAVRWVGPHQALLGLHPKGYGCGLIESRLRYIGGTASR